MNWVAEAGALHDDSGEPACDDADDDPAAKLQGYTLTHNNCARTLRLQAPPQ